MRLWLRELAMPVIPDISKQELAIMNAEMAARIFMLIAQQPPSGSSTPAMGFMLTDQEQQALRDVCGASDPSLSTNAPEFDPSMGQILG
jgi:hypothetical protein